jgi:hypothetical protein
MKKELLLLASVFGLSAGAMAQVNLQHHSHTPTLVNVNTSNFPTVVAKSLISSADTLAQTPSYRFGGSADGSGILRNSDSTFFLIVNHEDNFAVSRILLDMTFMPISGEYILNSNAGMWRLCSATMATPEVHGFGPMFLTCGESSVESMTHMVNPFGNAVTDSTIAANTTLAVGLGRWNAENALPLPKEAYPGQTIVLIGDDDSGPDGGQVAMYVANGQGNLNSGRLYVLRRTDLNQVERNIPIGSSVSVEFVEIPNHTTMTGAQINSYSNATLNAMRFQRVEDLDFRKGSPEAGREIYFNATGAATADSTQRTVWGRVYRLVLDPNNPLQGTLECVINGDDKSASNPYRELYQPDNIVVTEDYVYVQEDPNGYTATNLLPYVHDAKIYQYDIETGAWNTLLTMDHHRNAVDSATYNRNSAGTAYSNSGIGSWEFGAMVDISNETGIPNTFYLCVQPHTWRYPQFSGVDGGTLRPTEKQGSLIVTLENVPRVKVTAPMVSSATICAGSTTELMASEGTNFYMTNGTTYRWYTAPTGGTAFYTGSTYTTPALSSNTTYYVETYASGTASATRTAVTVTVNATPAQPTITANGNVLTSSSATGNQWYRNGVMIAGATSQNYTATQDGFYTVQVSVNGCISPMSAEHFAFISVGIEELEAANMNVFPNPNDGNFTVRFKSKETSTQVRVRIANNIGQILVDETFNGFSGEFNETFSIENAAKGTYYVIISTDQNTYRQQVVRQ